MTTIDQPDLQIEMLLSRIETLAAERERIIVAIVGAPGSGKSTLSDALANRLNAGGEAVAAVVPMDGFHLDDDILARNGTLARKGAPFTFDVGGLDVTLERLRRNEEDAIFVPVFDRDLEISRAGARLIAKTHRIILVEGNYLLLDERPWSELKRYFDLAIALDVPSDVLEQRLTARWTGHGLSIEDARKKARQNDLINAELVRKHGLSGEKILRIATSQ